MVGAMVSQLTQNASAEEMKKAGLDPYYTDHGAGIYPQSAGGIPWSAAGIQSSGNPVADLYEDMAAEQKAKKTYQYLLDQMTDPDVCDPLKFLREREIVHFQRFGEALRFVDDYMNSKRIFYAK